MTLASGTLGAVVWVACATTESSSAASRDRGEVEASGGSGSSAQGTVAFEPFSVTLPGAEITLDMVPVAGGEIDGRPVAAFWMSRTEVTWDAFDIFLYGKETDGIDAVSRPSVPYISMDRGFGHEGWPVLSLSAQGGRAFCEWLQKMSGRPFRLPSEDEWEFAARADLTDPDTAGWHAGNSGGTTHPVGSKPAGALGLHDLAGNAGEWVIAANGRALLAGGTYRDTLDKIGAGARRNPSAAWNASDPQIPKSTWWLADAGFTGLRVVCAAP